MKLGSSVQTKKEIIGECLLGHVTGSNARQVGLASSFILSAHRFTNSFTDLGRVVAPCFSPESKLSPDYLQNMTNLITELRSFDLVLTPLADQVSVLTPEALPSGMKTSFDNEVTNFLKKSFGFSNVAINEVRLDKVWTHVLDHTLWLAHFARSEHDVLQMWDFCSIYYCGSVHKNRSKVCHLLWSKICKLGFPF